MKDKTKNTPQVLLRRALLVLLDAAIVAFSFYFALLQYSPMQAFTARFVPSMQLYRPRCKTDYRALQGLFM